MDVDATIQGCPEDVVASIDQDVVLDAIPRTVGMRCLLTNRDITVTTVPPTADRRTPLVKCNLKEDGTCPFLRRSVEN